MPNFTKKSVPAFFALLTILAYGLLIPWLGFYWDDWPFAWIGEFLGPSEFIPAFRPFRPFLGPIFVVTTSLLPPIPFVWQIFGLIIRLSSALAAWWALKQIWPERKFQTLSVSLLFLLFPGYSQQWVALTHINQEWISLIAYLLSFGLTASALRNPSKPKSILALLLLFWGLFPTEYFIGMEPLRLLIIFILLPKNISPFWMRVKRSLQIWTPYLLLWLANAGWLAYYHTQGGYNSYSVEASSGSAGVPLQLIQGIGDALYKAVWLSWMQVIGQFSQSLTAPTTIIGLALVLFTFTLIFIYFQRLKLGDSAKGSKIWATQAILIGLAGVLLGRAPSWLAGLPLKLQTTFDRLTISIMFASALLVAGLLELLIRNRKWRMIALSGLLALAVGQQFMSANDFRRDWERQRNLAWQLSWRIPALEEGTALITHQLPMVYESDQSFTAPLNWIYAPDYRAGDDLPFALVNTEKRLGGGTIPSLEPGTPITVPYRTVSFHGSTSAAIVIYAPKNGCLRVLDPVYANERVYNREDDFLTDTIFLSDPSRILTETEGATVPDFLFGKEPAHTWCYYSTKAELARQLGDWVEVAHLGNEAEAEGYHPVDAFEWLPFIEAYIYTEKLDRAEELSQIAYQKEPRLHKGLCELWGRGEANTPLVEGEELAKIIQDELDCFP